MEISVICSRERERKRSDMKIGRAEDFFRNLNGIQLRVLDGGYAADGLERNSSVIAPPYSRLYYICGGVPYIEAEGDPVRLEQGWCCLLPAGFSFRFACRTAMEQLYFHIQLVDDTGIDLLRSCREMLAMPAGEERIRRMRSLTDENSPRASLGLRQELYGTLLSLLDAGGVELSRTVCSPCVLDAVGYIREHLSLQLTVGELAAHAHVSESTLEKTFRAEMGQSIGRYIDQEIFLKAESRLRHTDLSIAQMSAEFGFCDQFYFSRRFRERYGLSPRQYRRERPI